MWDSAVVTGQRYWEARGTGDGVRPNLRSCGQESGWSGRKESWQGGAWLHSGFRERDRGLFGDCTGPTRVYRKLWSDTPSGPICTQLPNCRKAEFGLLRENMPRSHRRQGTLIKCRNRREAHSSTHLCGGIGKNTSAVGGGPRPLHWMRTGQRDGETEGPGCCC